MLSTKDIVPVKTAGKFWWWKGFFLSVIFHSREHHKLNSIYLCCSWVEAETGQVKPKLSAWLDTTEGDSGKSLFFIIRVDQPYKLGGMCISKQTIGFLKCFTSVGGRGIW